MYKPADDAVAIVAVALVAKGSYVVRKRLVGCGGHVRLASSSRSNSIVHSFGRLGLVFPIFVLSTPYACPMSYILGSSIDASVYDPQNEHDGTTPENNTCRESYPKHDGLPEHVEHLEGKKENDEHQGDAGEIGLLCDMVDQRNQIGLDCRCDD